MGLLTYSDYCSMRVVQALEDMSVNNEYSACMVFVHHFVIFVPNFSSVCRYSVVDFVVSHDFGIEVALYALFKMYSEPLHHYRTQAQTFLIHECQLQVTISALQSMRMS